MWIEQSAVSVMVLADARSPAFPRRCAAALCCALFCAVGWRLENADVAQRPDCCQNGLCLAVSLSSHTLALVFFLPCDWSCWSVSKFNLTWLENRSFSRFLRTCSFLFFILNV